MKKHIYSKYSFTHMYTKRISYSINLSTMYNDVPVRSKLQYIYSLARLLMCYFNIISLFGKISYLLLYMYSPYYFKVYARHNNFELALALTGFG